MCAICNVIEGYVCNVCVGFERLSNPNMILCDCYPLDVSLDFRVCRGMDYAGSFPDGVFRRFSAETDPWDTIRSAGLAPHTCADFFVQVVARGEPGGSSGVPGVGLGGISWENQRISTYWHYRGGIRLLCILGDSACEGQTSRYVKFRPKTMISTTLNRPSNQNAKYP